MFFTEKPKYEIEEYILPNGSAPFSKWLSKLKDKRAQAKIRAKITRAAFGNFGDFKRIQDAPYMMEMREHYGPGYRIFFTVVERRIILLLAGSDKKDQAKTIEKAKTYLNDYKQQE